VGGITNPVHLAFIAVIALVFLGPKRLPDLARTIGNGMREFRDAISGESATEPTEPNSAIDAPAPVAQPVATETATAPAPADQAVTVNAAATNAPPSLAEQELAAPTPPTTA
jgi:TatA/E family protein of Tat protein translocase